MSDLICHPVIVDNTESLLIEDSEQGHSEENKLKVSVNISFHESLTEEEEESEGN